VVRNLQQRTFNAQQPREECSKPAIHTKREEELSLNKMAEDGWMERLVIGNMKPIKLFLIAVLVVLAGCHMMTGSGIPKAVTDDSVIQTVGSAQGIHLVGGNLGEMFSPFHQALDQHWDATIALGTAGQLLAQYRRAVEGNITSRGGIIGKASFLGTTNDVQEFSFDYVCGSYSGSVRSTVVGSSGRGLQVKVFCEEHRK
jgi:hypothetical protein